MGKQKFYVVWKGRKTGIFESWDDCKTQINGFADAQYKSFKTRALAEEAFKSDPTKFIGQDIFESELTEEQIKLIGNPILDSISVDAAWNTFSGVVEYQGVNTKTREKLFSQGPFEDGTINIVEFLAIVHALAYCKQYNISIPIYSDSRNAIKWVKEKEVKTLHVQNEKNKKLFDLIDRAITWLNNNEYTNQILKWETKAWGENPADFDRK